MTPQELAARLASFGPQELGAMDHALLYQAREHVPRDQQNKIAPYEHRAFAREAIQENPALALPIAAGVLAYQPYKWVRGARSRPSLDQVTEGFTGVGEGLWRAFQDGMSRAGNSDLVNALRRFGQ